MLCDNIKNTTHSHRSNTVFTIFWYYIYIEGFTIGSGVVKNVIVIKKRKFPF